MRENGYFWVQKSKMKSVELTHSFTPNGLFNAQVLILTNGLGNPKGNPTCGDSKRGCKFSPNATLISALTPITMLSMRLSARSYAASTKENSPNSPLALSPTVSFKNEFSISLMAVSLVSPESKRK